MRRLMIFAFLALPLFMPGIAAAQTDESTLPATDYGAGYKIIIFHRHQEHPPAPNSDLDGQGPIKLDLTYPIIASPHTPGAELFNAAMKRMSATWWEAIGAPKDNKTASDPDTDISLNCEPVGLPPPVDGNTPPNAQMLPGVISVACGYYMYGHGYAHGAGDNWGLNWIVLKRRALRASDIFNVKTNWLTALTDLVDADRGSPPENLRTLDFSDTSHWVVSSVGLGFTYSDAAFANVEDGGMGTIDFIPWSNLDPYLRQDGVVPRADW